MNYFTFDGTDSRTYNTYIATSNMFDGAEEDVEAINIPGSNRIIYLSNGTFKPFTIKAFCYIPSDMQNKVDALRSYLKSLNKPCRYIEALKPTEYRVARYIDAFELDTSDRQGASFELTFLSRPERFLTSGDEVTTLTSNGTINNPTLFNSKPLLRVYGNGTLTIGDYTITTTNNSTSMYIDCDTMQCYSGSTNKNNDVTLDEFPQLTPGSNSITLSGITQVDITGRWFNI